MSTKKQNKNKSNKKSTRTQRQTSSGYVPRRVPTGMTQIGVADDGTIVYSSTPQILQQYWPDLYQLSPNAPGYIFTGKNGVYTPVGQSNHAYDEIVNAHPVRVQKEAIGPEITVIGHNNNAQEPELSTYNEGPASNPYNADDPFLQERFKQQFWNNGGRDIWLKQADARARALTPTLGTFAGLAAKPVEVVMPSNLLGTLFKQIRNFDLSRLSSDLLGSGFGGGNLGLTEISDATAKWAQDNPEANGVINMFGDIGAGLLTAPTRALINQGFRAITPSTYVTSGLTNAGRAIGGNTGRFIASNAGRAGTAADLAVFGVPAYNAWEGFIENPTVANGIIATGATVPAAGPAFKTLRGAVPIVKANMPRVYNTTNGRVAGFKVGDRAYGLAWPGEEAHNLGITSQNMYGGAPLKNGKILSENIPIKGSKVTLGRGTYTVGDTADGKTTLISNTGRQYTVNTEALGNKRVITPTEQQLSIDFTSPSAPTGESLKNTNSLNSSSTGEILDPTFARRLNELFDPMAGFTHEEINKMISNKARQMVDNMSKIKPNFPEETALQTSEVMPEENSFITYNGNRYQVGSTNGSDVVLINPVTGGRRVENIANISNSLKQYEIDGKRVIKVGYSINGDPLVKYADGSTSKPIQYSQEYFDKQAIPLDNSGFPELKPGDSFGDMEIVGIDRNSGTIQVRNNSTNKVTIEKPLDFIKARRATEVPNTEANNNAAPETPAQQQSETPVSQQPSDSFDYLNDFAGEDVNGWNGLNTFGSSTLHWRVPKVPYITINGKTFPTVGGKNDNVFIQLPNGSVKLINMPKLFNSNMPWNVPNPGDNGYRYLRWGPQKQFNRFNNGIAIPGVQYRTFWGRNPKSLYEPGNGFREFIGNWFPITSTIGGIVGTGYGLYKLISGVGGQSNNNLATVAGENTDTLDQNDYYVGNSVFDEDVFNVDDEKTDTISEITDTEVGSGELEEGNKDYYTAGSDTIVNQQQNQNTSFNTYNEKLKFFKTYSLGNPDDQYVQKIANLLQRKQNGENISNEDIEPYLDALISSTQQ